MLTQPIRRGLHRKTFPVVNAGLRRFSGGSSGSRGGSGTLGLGMTAAAAAGLAALGYNYRKDLADAAEEPEAEAAGPDLALETELFEHPYNKRSALFRWLLTVRRMVWLTGCFAPLAAASLALFLLPSKAVRRLWLRVLLWSMRTAGCTFQKFGQWMSMRPDMLPADVIAALEPLRHGKVPEHSAAHNRAMVRESFGAELEELFSEFDEKVPPSAPTPPLHQRF